MATLPGGDSILEFNVWILRPQRRVSLAVRFSISSRVILAGGSTLDWNQEYLLCVLLDRLPSCHWARETLIRKRCQRFWNAFSPVKITDTLLIMGSIFHRNRNPGFVHSSAFVARYQDAVLSR